MQRRVFLPIQSDRCVAGLLLRQRNFVRLLPGNGPGTAQLNLLPVQHFRRDPFDALWFLHQAPLGVCPAIHRKQPPAIRGCRDHRDRAKAGRNGLRQGVGSAQVAADQGDGKAPPFVHRHHGGVRGLVPQMGRNGPHRNADSPDKNQALFFRKLLCRPYRQGIFLVNSRHASAELLRQTPGQVLPPPGEGGKGQGHVVALRNSVEKSGA